jgi:hypothetical protein
VSVAAAPARAAKAKASRPAAGPRAGAAAAAAAGGAGGAGGAAAPGTGGGSGDALGRGIADARVVATAEAAAVVWARVRGYPFWPARASPRTRLACIAIRLAAVSACHRSQTRAPRRGEQQSSLGVSKGPMHRRVLSRLDSRRRPRGAGRAAQAQVMSEAETAVRLGGVRRSREQTLGVMFFSTLEIAWMAPGETVAWGDGLRRGLYARAKGRRAFVAAAQMVRDRAPQRVRPGRSRDGQSAAPVRTGPALPCAPCSWSCSKPVLMC